MRSNQCEMSKFRKRVNDGLAESVKVIYSASIDESVKVVCLWEPVMDPGRVEAGFDQGTDPTDLMSKTDRYWKSDTEFSLKVRTEPGPASETLGLDSTDKSREI